MITKKITVHKVGQGPHEFTKIEFIISDNLRTKIEKKIHELISGLNLAHVWDDGKMVKLTPDELNVLNNEDGILGVEEIQEHFGQFYRPAKLDDFENQPENCKQVTRHIPFFPETIAELLSSDMGEVVNYLKKYGDEPYKFVIITNAPIGFPFSQKNDKRYQNIFPSEVIKDRQPIAEAFQYGLLQASGHSIDAPFPGRSFAPVTPFLQEIGDAKNRLLEELSSSQPFYLHIDGANYDEYSSQICLAFGTGDSFSETILGHNLAILGQLDDLDSQQGRFANGMGRLEVLTLDIFEHGPGKYSTCMNIVQAPIFDKDLDSVLRPRINLIDNRTRIRSDKLPELNLTQEEGSGSFKLLK